MLLTERFLLSMTEGVPLTQAKQHSSLRVLSVLRLVYQKHKNVEFDIINIYLGAIYTQVLKRIVLVREISMKEVL